MTIQFSGRSLFYPAAGAFAIGVMLLGPLAMPAGGAPRGSAPLTVPIDNAQQYNACMQLAKTRPRDAYASANAWYDKGGGVGAQHCAAVALFNLGEFVEAAQRLERLANDGSTNRIDLRASLFAQAGEAWSMANLPERALSAQNNALLLSPDNAEFLIDRAVTKAGMDQLDGAVADLSQAVRLAPGKYEALTLRATAYRLLGKQGPAAADVEQAIRLNPDYPEAYIERGRQRLARGEKAPARDDFVKALRLVPEASDLAAEARAGLEKIDVKPR